LNQFVCTEFKVGIKLT